MSSHYYISTARGEVHLGDSEGEIVSWVESEWIEDPEVVISIVHAVRFLIEFGGDFLRSRIQLPKEIRR